MGNKIEASPMKKLAISPRWGGDNILNPDVYYPVPNLGSPFQQMQAVNGLLYAQGQSRSSAFFTYRGMMPFTASSGPPLVEEILLNPAPILDHSVRLSPGDEKFLTMQGASKVLPPQIVARVFEKNQADEAILGNIARQNIRGDGVLIGRPDMREYYPRNLKHSHSALRNTVYEDSAFEIFYWHQHVAIDQSFFVYGGPHAWSYNAPLEKSMQAGIQYGYATLMKERDGRSSDSYDIYGNKLSIVDVAHETARGVVDLLTSEVRHQGGAYRFRFDTGALEYLTRSMYNHMDLNELGQRFGNPHESVLEHRHSDALRARFEELDRHMLPFLAEHCDTPTFRRILGSDKALNGYWQEQVLPRRQDLKTEREIITNVLGKEVNGSYISNTVRAKVEKNAESGSKPVFLSVPTSSKAFLGYAAGSSIGQRENIFDEKFAPKSFDPDLFSKLAPTARDGELGARQEAVLHVVATTRPSGTTDPDYPYTLLLWDKPNTSVVADEYRAKNNISDIRQTKGAVNKLKTPANSFQKAVVGPALEAGEVAQDALRLNLDWRAENKVGNVLLYSTVDSNCTFTGRDKQTGLDRRQVFSAGDSLKDKEALRSTVLHRLAASEWNGLVLMGPSIDEELALTMSATLIAVTGQAERVNSGTDFVSAFYQMDNNFVPRKLDVGDMILRVAKEALPALTKPSPDERRFLYGLMAQLLYVYDSALDAAGVNQEYIRSAHHHGTESHDQFDFSRMDQAFLSPIAYTSALSQYYVNSENGHVQNGVDEQNLLQDPLIQKFLDGSLDIDEMAKDPVEKATLIQMIRFPMRKLILERGIGAMEYEDIKDIHDPEYKTSYKAWHSRSEDQKTAWLRQTDPSSKAYVQGPEISR